ncbi:MAG: RNA polymerase sigma factor, partial [Flavobacteriales bacterium]
NSIIDNFRKNKKHLHHEEFDNYHAELKMNHINPIEESIGYNEIIELLDQLPEGSRNVFNLYVIEGYKHNEIAEMLDYTVSNSKWHLSNARKILKELLINQRNIALFIMIAIL